MYKQITFPAPSGGWVRSTNLLMPGPGTAEVLDNIFPTAQGARLRRGFTTKATITGAVVELFTYEGAGGTDALFASSAIAVFDVTSPADADVAETPVMSEFTSGAWSAAHFSAAGGDYLIGVNGSDYSWLHDGTGFQPIADEAVNDLAVTGISGNFVLGETVTGGTSGATAKLLGVHLTAADAGTLKIGTVSGGPFQAETVSGAGASASASGAETSASAITITGVDTSELSHVFQHQRRLWFIGSGMSAWYLPTVSIGGAASEFPMGSLFRRGGDLLFGINWTQDSGEGMDDRAIFVTSEGEMAVYTGTDPDVAAYWSLQGIYDIGRPLGKNAWFRDAGDVQILTEDGVISATTAMRLDRTGARQQAISFPIEDAWRDVVANRAVTWDFSATLWPSQTMLLIGIPALDESEDQAFVSNARTGAWARFTNYDVRTSHLFADLLYFGRGDGKVMQAEASGADKGNTYVGRWVPRFIGGETPNVKIANRVGCTLRATVTPIPKMQAFSDYEVSGWKAAPAAPPAISGSTWGTAVWGTSVWGSTANLSSYSFWQGANGIGQALSFGLQVSSGDTQTPTLQIVKMQAMYEEGEP